MIALMVLGAFVAFGGAALTSRRGSVPGMAVLGGMLRFFGATALAAIGAVVLGIVDVHPDDTRPGVEIVWLVSGEANPEPVGAGPDSLLRTANLKRVLDASRAATSGKARVSGLDVRPDSVALTIQNGSRTLTLRYGYDAQLDLARHQPASNGATEETIALDDIDPAGPERLAKASRRAGSKGLRDVQYVLLDDRRAATAVPACCSTCRPAATRRTSSATCTDAGSRGRDAAELSRSPSG